MSWKSGGPLAAEIWNTVEDYIPEEKKSEVALAIVEAFEGGDCDTMDYYDFYHIARPTCFVSGHLDLTPEEFDVHYKPRIDEMVNRGCGFVVGDARGADLMAQQYLADMGYGNVIVFHMGDEPRNIFEKYQHDCEGCFESGQLPRPTGGFAAFRGRGLHFAGLSPGWHDRLVDGSLPEKRSAPSNGVLCETGRFGLILLACRAAMLIAAFQSASKTIPSEA